MPESELTRLGGSLMDPDPVEYARSAEFELLGTFEGRVIEQLRGVGQVGLADGLSAECAFGCVRLDDGRVMVECHLLAGAVRQLIDRFGRTRGEWVVDGHTTEGSLVRVEGAVATRWRESKGEDDPSKVKMRLSCDEIHVSMPTAARLTPARVTYGLTNLEFWGDEKSQLESGGWVYAFRFQVGSTEVVVRQVDGYREIVEQAKPTRTGAVTAEASVPLRRGMANLPYYDEMMDVVCSLLSLARGTRVTWHYAKLWAQDGTLIEHDYPGNVSWPWIDTGALLGGANGTELKLFVSCCYDAYFEARDRFNLPVVIGYYLASKCEPEMYTKFLLACTAMETLISNFAEKGTQGDLRYIVPEDKFKEKRDELEGLVSEALVRVFPRLSEAQVDDARVKVAEINRRSYRRLVRKMLEEVGVDFHRQADLRFIDLRHKLVHTGVLGTDVRESLGHYSRLIELLDRVLLKILQYEGQYQKYSDVFHFRPR